MNRHDPMGVLPRRCTAHNRQGQQCGMTPVPGSNVCHWHGGAAPQVQARARMRLAALVDPALGRLARILLQGNDRDAIRAIENVLDRAGVPRGGQPDDTDARELLAQYLIDLRDGATDTDGKVVDSGRSDGPDGGVPAP